jgi:CRISPR-associated protein Csb2
MLAIQLDFIAGRYHANPWGRHVNEADVEWPPSPWRLLRALIATWHRKLDQSLYSEELLESLIHKVSGQLPAYRLPPAIRTHSRHYMPVREGAKEKPVLIFDAFVRVETNEPLIAVWENVQLEPREEQLLAILLHNLGFLGRTESWAESALLTDWKGNINCLSSELALDTETGEIREPVRLITPMASDEYRKWHSETIASLDWESMKRKVHQQLKKTLPEKLIDALRLETGDIQAAGWSQPPGAKFVTYQRPYDCFRAQTKPRILHVISDTPGRSNNSVRIALHGKPLPRIEDAVRVGEWLRMGLMGKAKRILGENNIPRVLSGHEMPEENKHDHAFYLPEDVDGDGHIDHITVYARSGFDRDTLRVLKEMTRLWNQKGQEWKLILEDYGPHERLKAYSPLLAESATWASVTPYLHPWFQKKNFTVADQIKKECRIRSLPEPVKIERLESICINGRERKPIHFHRFRNKRGLTQPDTHGSFWKLTFPQPVYGPLALGFGCHYGLGMFKAK